MKIEVGNYYYDSHHLNVVQVNHINNNWVDFDDVTVDKNGDILYNNSYSSLEARVRLKPLSKILNILYGVK